MESYPNWLLSLLTIKNDHSQCEKHIDRSKKYYCVNCCSQICEQCKKDDHQKCNYIIQLRKATPSQKSQKTPNLSIANTYFKGDKKFMLLNDVKAYKFNQLSVYYIFSRPSSIFNIFSCKICGHKLESDDNLKYCSLQCMVNGVESNKAKGIDVKNIKNTRVEVKTIKSKEIEIENLNNNISLEIELFSCVASTSNIELEQNINYEDESKELLLPLNWGTKKIRTLKNRKARQYPPIKKKLHRRKTIPRRASPQCFVFQRTNKEC